MTVDEFVEQVVVSGYVPGRNTAQKKKNVLEWLLLNPKQIYTPEDFIEVYRYFEYPKKGEQIPHGRWRYEGFGNKHTWRHSG